MKRVVCLFLAALAALFGLLEPALANEAVTYTYDALGRLVTVSSSGTVNNGQSVATTFDPAGNRTNYTITGATAGPVYVSIGNASVTEGGTLAFPVTLSSALGTAVTVSYSTANATATAGSDYNAVTSGSVSIAAGQTSATINITTIDDTAVESVETMAVTISSPTGGAVLGTSIGTGTINDNDTPPANLAIGNASATEGGNLVFTVTRSGTTTTAVSVNFASASGTATSGSDFTATSGTLSFAANQTTGTITVPTIDDTATESTETMTVTLSGASSGATITTATGTGTITDNDAGWSSSLTSGYFTDNCAWGCYSLDGYIANWFGAMSNTTFGSYTITGLYDSYGQIYLTMSGSTLPPNSGWTSITIPGVGTLTRATATYSGSGTSAYWYWNNASIIASGTVTIQ